ncbi:MAG: hypothetical protein M4579_001786 [Chaenotheca gracillima]|nr:MAG: hypothetical protein M4579_001786 [Chaenotheca gracillima]
MADITPSLNTVLSKHGTSISNRRWELTSTTDEFLKEAYRITAHIASLHAYLRSIRQSYLSTSLPRKKLQSSRHPSSSSHQLEEGDRQYFTDSQRDEIDAESKKLLQELHVAIQNLSDAEQIRQRTESTVAQQRHRKNGFGALGRWAAGGVGSVKSPEEELDEARMNTIKIHRESILWYIRRKLEDCGEAQRSMMETRLMREVEKSKSALYKTQGMKAPPRNFPDSERGPSGAGTPDAQGRSLNRAGNDAAQMDDTERHRIESQLSPEQLQLFAEENQDMLKHYEDTLDQVRTAERSLVEISELQTNLATNLATQSAHIDQLVADSFFTTENVGGGNKQLKRATERKSTAKYVFYGSCAFSLFLVTYDLLI